MTSSSPRPRSSTMFYGWWIVVFSFLAASYGGLIYFSFTTLFTPLVQEFGWSYTSISLGASMYGGEAAVTNAVTGFLMDRYSVRKIILVGSTVMGGGWLLMSRVNSLPVFYISFLIIATGVATFSSTVCFTLIARWFRKRLGLAIGITAAGSGAGGLAIPVMVYLLGTVGFRGVFVIFGVLSLVIGGLNVIFLRNRPEDIGTSPDGIPPEDSQRIPGIASVPPGAPEVQTQTRFNLLPVGLRKSSFWIISYLSFAAIFSMSMVSIHVMPYLESLHYSRQTAGVISMMIPVISGVGRLGIGWVSDFMGRRTLTILTLIGMAAGIVLFLNLRLFWLFIPFVVLYGISHGGINVLRVALLRDYLGIAYFGSLLGLMQGISGLATILGPFIAGWVFDTRGNYSPALVLNVVVLLMSLPLLWLLGRRRE